jgi:hypothetical protein
MITVLLSSFFNSDNITRTTPRQSKHYRQKQVGNPGDPKNLGGSQFRFSRHQYHNGFTKQHYSRDDIVSSVGTYPGTGK